MQDDDRGATDIRTGGGNAHDGGRWPANLIHDGSAEVIELFPEQVSGANPTRRGSPKLRNAFGDFEGQQECEAARGTDAGSAARFFYCAKADRQDRNDGCEDLEPKSLNWSSGDENPGSFQAEGTDRTSPNHHPTVKPVDLMRYLCRLVTPTGGHILDPFSGSGSTGKASILEGFNPTLIELDADDEGYIEIIRNRIRHACGRGTLFDTSA